MVLREEDTAAFVTWASETDDREDPEYYNPATLALEQSLEQMGAIPLSLLASVEHRRFDASRHRGTFRYIDISSVNTSSGDVQPEELDVADAPSRARQLVKVDDVIVSLVRPSRNAVAYISEALDGCVCSTGFAVLRRRQIHPFALFAFLKSRIFVVQALRRCTASMYPALAEEDLKTILVPSLIIERSAELTQAVQRAFELREGFLLELQRLRQSVESLVTEVETKAELENIS